MIARKLGRCAPGPQAQEVPPLRAIRAMLPPLPKPPPFMCWTSNVSGPFDVLGNDKIGDCAIVAPAQLMRVATSVCGAERKPTLAAVEATYSAVSGYNPMDPSTDNGCVVTDVLARWKGDGLQLDGGLPDKLLGYIALNPHDLDELRWGICWFGGIYCGWNLPELALNATRYWRMSQNPADMKIAGGHATACCTYSEAGFDQITWGEFMLATPNFTPAFLEEAYVPVMADWMMPSGTTPSGFSRVELEDRIKALAAAAATA